MENEFWRSKKNDGKQNMLPKMFGSFSIEMPAGLSEQVAKHMPCQLDSACGSSEVVLWSHGDGEELAHLRHLHPYTAGLLAIHGDLYKHNIKFMLHQLFTNCQYYSCMVQFWAPIATNGCTTALSTADQPFAFTKYLTSTRRFLSYRRHCLDTIIPLHDGHGGPVARVFQHGFPEFNSLISTYSHQEFPMRDAAISWGIRAYLALPVFSLPGQPCIGVLEILSSSSTIFRSVNQLYQHPKVVHLMSAEMFFSGDLILHSKIGHKSALDKLREILSVVCQTYKLPMAQTWIPAQGTASTSVQSLITAPETIYYDKQKWPKGFTWYSDLYYLRKGQWVVGRAFSSLGCCFCWDASQMTITEYPMLPFARHVGLKSSFAICLRCTSNENSVYVIELYLCPLLQAAIRSFLNELIGILKEELPDFTVGSGQKLGQCLVVEVIKSSEEDEDLISSFEIGEHELSPKADGGDIATNFDDLLYLIEGEELRSWEEIVQPHLEVDTTLMQQNSCEEKVPENGETNIINGLTGCDAEHSEVAVELQNGEKMMQPCSEVDTASEPNHQTHSATGEERNGGVGLKRTGANRICRWQQDYGITRQILEQLFDKSRDDAAKTLDVSPSTLKRACRDFGIPRWRNHKRRRPNGSLNQKEVVKQHKGSQQCHDLPPEEGTSAIQVNMTAKVTYKEHTVKFPLSSSLTMKYLEEEVIKRLSYLNISLDNFVIKYQDEEDEWISLACDLDLMYGMSMLRSSGKMVIRMMVFPNSD